MGTVVLVVEDLPGLLVTYLPPGAPFAFPDGDWPGGRHPWHGRGGWTGHGVLMLHRPGDRHAVWHFWEGPERRFAGWYLNLQEPFRRTRGGFDTQDLELDVWIPAGGRPQRKDWELLGQRVAEGRFTVAEAESILADGEALAAAAEAGARWWDDDWAAWAPDPAWAPGPLPPGWDVVEPAELVTERLVLRPLGEPDRDWLVALYVEAGDSSASAARELDDALAHARREGFGHYGAWLGGEPAAVVELHRAGPGVEGIEPDEVEIGWVVARAHRGRGVATEAVAAVAAQALDGLGLDHVVAYIRPANGASVRVAEKVGLTRRGPGRSRGGDPVEIWELRR
jgi:RimJ/RimL family protein N-acetyltransferase